MPHRLMIGIIGWSLSIVGVVLFLCGPQEDTWRMVCSGCVRVGAVMVVLWLAYRDVSRVPMWLYGCTFLSLIIIAVYRKAFFVLAPTVIVLWLLRPRTSRSNGVAAAKRPRSDKPKPPAHDNSP